MLTVAPGHITESVQKMNQAIYMIIFFISVEMMCKAISLQQTVKWQYLSPDKEYVDYNTELNYHIELAHQHYRKTKQSSTFSFKCETKKYVLKFDSVPMQAENVNSQEVMEVKRTLCARVNQKGENHNEVFMHVHAVYM